MDYVFSISVPSLAIILVSAVLVLSCGQTDRQNHRIAEAVIAVLTQLLSA